MGGAEVPVRPPVPMQAVIPWGFAREEAAGLGRALTDAARFGFRHLLVPVPAALAHRAEAIAAALPPLPHLPRVHIAPLAATTAGDALAQLRPALEPSFLLVDPARVVEANWLELALRAPLGGHALALAHALAPAGAAPDAPAGLALLARDALPPLPPGADLPALLRLLAADARTALWRLPAGAVRPAHAATPARPPRPALFLDRDGTLNADYGYVSDPTRLVLLPGAGAAVKRANDRGWSVFLVTNQSGVGRGYYAEADAIACNAALHDLLRAQGAHLDDIRYAADHPEAVEARYRAATGWRKPAPGMLIDLMAHWPVLREKSLMVGDKDSDVAAGEAAGIRGLLCGGGDLDALLAPHLRPPA